MTKGEAARIEKIRTILVEQFPLAFMPKRTPKKPLKIGIRDDVLALTKDLKAYWVRRAIGDYCGGLRYLENLIEGTPRIDLGGNEVGSVTADQAETALVHIENLRAAWERAR